MSGWQSELESLLAQLHVVAPDEPDVLATPSDGFPAEDPDIFEEDAGDRTVAVAEDGPTDGDEVRAVRSELEATIHRIARMTRTGSIDISLRDDIAFVLQALMRVYPQPVANTDIVATSAVTNAQEWQLTTAAAILRFCRIILMLADVIDTGDSD